MERRIQTARQRGRRVALVEGLTATPGKNPSIRETSMPGDILLEVDLVVHTEYYMWCNSNNLIHEIRLTLVLLKFC